MTDLPAKREVRAPDEKKPPRFRIRLVEAIGRELDAIYTLTEPLSTTPASVHRERLDRLVADHIYTTDEATVVIETYRGGDMVFSLRLSEPTGDDEPENRYTVYVQPSFLPPGFAVHATYWRFGPAVLVSKTKRLTAIEKAFTRFLQQLVPYEPNESTVVVEGCG